MFRSPGQKTICVDLRIIFLIHVAIFDPLFSILDSYPSLLSPQHLLLSTESALRSPRGVLALVETIQLGRAVTPQGESSSIRSLDPNSRELQISLASGLPLDDRLPLFENFLP